jgi:hypothetical protein
MIEPLRFGLIGVDSSHALQFTRLLADGRGRVQGATVISAWKGPTSADFPPSRDRNDSNADALAGLGVELLGSAQEVAEASDALLLVSSDVRTRREQFERIAPFGKPVYVDTRFAANVQDARKMLQTADAHDCLVLSGSPKRFTPQVQGMLSSDVSSIDLSGPIVVQPGHPGLAWYGVHLVDLAVAALGPGCDRVEPGSEGLRLLWDDGRSATISGPTEWNPWTRGRARTSDGDIEFEIEANEGMLVGLLESVISSYHQGTVNIAPGEILEIAAIVQAGSAALADGRSHALRSPGAGR